MEAVPPDALIVIFVWDREGFGREAVAAMERGVEAGHLKHTGIAGFDGFDRRQIVRLVQGRQRHQFPQLRHHSRSDHGRAGVIGAAMNDPVTHRQDPRVAQEAVEPLADDVKCRVMVGGAGAVGPAGFRQHRAIGALRDEMRMGADAFDLPDRQHADRFRSRRCLDRELDAA